ncbi:MAG: ABC transporter ATP-binding protein/permease [Lachnoclostridium sp.]|nr:ABC transporter ATP-binding protein/permease [Lachnoclostridium sp.]
MLKLLKYLRGFKKESVIGPLFKLTEAVFELFIPLVMVNMIDIGIHNKDRGYIFLMGAIMILLGVLGLVCSLTAQYFAAKAAAGFGTKLRNDLMKHINRFSYTELDEIGTSALISRMTNDTHQAQTAVNLALRLFLRAPFIVVGAVIMAFTVHKGLAVVFVVLVPILSLSVFGIIYLSVPIYRKVQKKLEELLLVVRENLTGIRVVRSFAREEYEKENFLEKSSLLNDFQLLAGKVSGLLNPISMVLVNAAVLLLLWYGSKEVDIGNLTQGELVALLNYMMQILIALVAFAFLMVSYMKGLGAAARIEQVFEIVPTEVETAHDLKEVRTHELKKNRETTSVELKGVSFSYAGSKLSALQDVSFRIERGQTVGIIGGTGSGKSTLAHLIAGFYPVTKGTLQVNTDRIGIVPQKAVLFRGTVRDNIKWGKSDAADDEIWYALEAAQAREFVEEKGEGLDFIITEGGNNLSGGQRQRLTIARAIVGKPDILILDDSASALDILTERRLRESIYDNIGDMTILFISQRVVTVRDADRIVVLDEGCIVGMGTHKELREKCAIYEEICRSQLPEEKEEVTSRD